MTSEPKSHPFPISFSYFVLQILILTAYMLFLAHNVLSVYTILRSVSILSPLLYSLK